jgi:hypothetical protein
MKRTLVVVAVLLFTSLLTSRFAWAEGTAGGGCSLPDVAGLSPDQVAVAALKAGLQMSAATSATTTIQACPATFQCSSIAGCGSSMICSATPIGQCCSAGAFVLCCTNEIFVVRCPCKCVLEDCPHQCGQSTQVTRSCS